MNGSTRRGGASGAVPPAGPGGVRRRDFLKTVGAAAAMPLFAINHAWSKDVTFDGEAFDAGGATLPVMDWPGDWEAARRRALFDDFEKEFNCTVVNRFPGHDNIAERVTEKGPRTPLAACMNWNLPTMFQVADAGDYFLDQAALLDNLPALRHCWMFAIANGVGITWAFARWGYLYRTDLVETPPDGFGAFLDARFDGHRAVWASESRGIDYFLLTAAAVLGDGPRDIAAGMTAARGARPGAVTIDYGLDLPPALKAGRARIGSIMDSVAYPHMTGDANLGLHLWTERRPVLTETATVSRYAPPLQKRLALALIDRSLRVEAQEAFIADYPFRPVNENATVPPVLAGHGVRNTGAQTADLWIPDWTWWNARRDAELATL